MSFTSNIKNEISSIEYGESEKMAELSGILNIAVKIYDDKFEIYSENISVARRIYLLIKEIYHVEITMDTGFNSLRGNKLVLLSVHEKIDLILSDLCIKINNERLYVPSDYLIDEELDKKTIHDEIHKALGKLPDIEKKVLINQYLIAEDSRLSIRDLARELHIKMREVPELEREALQHLGEAFDDIEMMKKLFKQAMDRSYGG